MNSFKKVSFLALPLCFVLACSTSGPSDQSLTTSIQAGLYANDSTRSANVKVAVAGGVVTLSGDVPSSDVELQAMKVANATAGVRQVKDQMRVQSAPAPQPASSEEGQPTAMQLAQNSRSAAPPPPPPANPVPVATPNGPPPLAQAPPPVVAPPAPPLEPSAPVKHEEMAQHDSTRPQPEEPPKPRTITIPAGETIAIRMIDGIDSKQNQQGEKFRASLAAPITSGERVIIPAGAPATVLLAEARGAGRIKGQSELELRLDSITYHGETVRVNTSAYEAKGSKRGKETAVRTGIAAGAGALIGALAGGGKGAAIGSIAGGGAGAGYQLATHGKQVKIPSETQVSFRLESPLVLTR